MNMMMLTYICTCSVRADSMCTKMLTFYMDIQYIYVYTYKSPKISILLTFPAKTLWVPAYRKISSEIFVGARAPKNQDPAFRTTC